MNLLATFSTFSRSQGFVSRLGRFWIICVVVGSAWLLSPNARGNGEDSPFGTATAFVDNAVITSAGSYNTYTGSPMRTVTDLAVPGAVGAYPLAFSRTSTGRYTPGEPTGAHAFGQAGSWRHSYNWQCYLDSASGSPKVWRVHYPDGSVIRFAAPVVGPQQYSDPYWHCVSLGVSERLEPVQGNADLIVHRADGGTVYLQNQGDNTFHATSITDPYGQATTLSYYVSTDPYPGQLKMVKEPAGRYLLVKWGSFNGDTVIANVSASNGQLVVYYYGTPVGGYTALTSITYSSDTDASGNPYQANYSYQADNTGAGLRPLLYSCNDPHFAGPMPRIRYSFVQSSSVPYGQIQAEIDDASSTTVSSYNQSSLTETRGDGPQSFYAYNGYLITNYQDYDAGHNQYGYDANGFLNSVKNADANTTSFTRDPYIGKRMSVSRQDTNGSLLTTSYDYGSTSKVPYPSNPYYLLSTTDPRGQKTTYTRNSNHQVSRIDYPDGTFEVMLYNGFGQMTCHQFSNANVLSYYYDTRGMVTQSTDAANGSNRYTKYAYDGLDRLTQVTDFNGYNTSFTYNGRHQLTQVKHHDNTHIDYTYDRFGNQTSVSDELQHVTTIGYDNKRRPVSLQMPVSTAAGTYRTTTFSYERGNDTTGNAHTHRGYGTMTLPSGKKVKRVYTGQGRLAKLTKGAGYSDATTDAYTYDGLGHVLTVVDANTITQATYTYDVLERKSTLTDANGHKTTWNYYGAGSGAYAGWLQSQVSPGSAVGTTSTTNYNTYDQMGRLLKTTDASGQYSGKVYDANGRLYSVSDQNGTYVYGYDADSRVNSLTYPDTTTQTWAYDPVGNVTSYKNRGVSGNSTATNGDTKTITYDYRNRPTGASWSNNAAPATAWGYDNASRVTDLNNWWVALHYTYDDSGLPLSEANTNGLVQTGAATNTTSYGYDKDGNVASLTYPAGDVPNYAYDDQNRCFGLEGFSKLYFQGEQVVGRDLGNDVTSEFSYQANNRISQVWNHHGTYGSGGWPNDNISAKIYGYAPDGQITWAARTPDGGGSGSAWEDGSGENYGYAPNGAISGFGIADLGTYHSDNNQGDSAATAAFLTGGNNANGPGSFSSSYQYDASGNRSQVQQFGGSSFGYSADDENHYYGSIYDGNGCTTNSAVGWTYAYDAEGHMTTATRQSDGYVMGFEYDGLGRLIYQTSNEGLLIFCYAGNQRIEERSLTNNASLYRYFFDSPKSDRITFRQQSNGQTYGGPRLYYQYDAVGNTTHVSDDGGNVLEQYLYDAYGIPYMYDKAGNYLGQTSPHDNRYLFHGASAYEWLDAPELYYCRARMYLPVHGRWLQPDPSGFAAGDMNLYRYCGNDPTNCLDPTGLKNYGIGLAATYGAGAYFGSYSAQLFVSTSWGNPLNFPVYAVISRSDTGFELNVSAGIQVVGSVTNTNIYNLAGTSVTVGGSNNVGVSESMNASNLFTTQSDGTLHVFDDGVANFGLGLGAGLPYTAPQISSSDTTVTQVGTVGTVLQAGVSAVLDEAANDAASIYGNSVPASTPFGIGQGGDTGGGGAGGGWEDEIPEYTGPDSGASNGGNGSDASDGGGADPSSEGGEVYSA